jgi:hypothetical protein
MSTSAHLEGRLHAFETALRALVEAHPQPEQARAALESLFQGELARLVAESPSDDFLAGFQYEHAALARVLGLADPHA